MKKTNNSKLSRYSNKTVIAILFSGVFAILGVLLLTSPEASTGTLEIIPKKSSTIIGSDVEAEVWLTPGGNVNGVEAELSYDSSELEFISIDASDSPFEVELGGQTGGDGKVNITRGSLDGDVSSTSLVAKVKFKTLKVVNPANIGLIGNATSNGSYTDPAVSGAQLVILAGNIGKLYISPATKIAYANQNTSVNLRLRPDTTVNGVEAELSYDNSKLQFVGIDASGSPFDVALGEQTGGNGKITITRGNLSTGVNSDSLVAKITFKALVGNGETTIVTSGNATKEGYYTFPVTENATLSLAVPDSTPPTVSISKPSDGATVLKQLTVEAQANDNIGVTEVKLYVDGRLEKSDTQAPYSFSFDTTGLTNGGHEIQAKAYDAAGNVGTSPKLTIIVKNWPEDINEDGIVNLLDFSLLASKFGQSGSTIGRTDINQDGTVNLLDFSLLAAKFGQ